MKINWKIVSEILAAVTVYDTVVSRKNRKVFAHNMALYNEVLNERNRVADLANFYADHLNKHQVPLDDFDRIVIDTLINE